MAVLIATHDVMRLHDTGPGHPERPDRLRAVLDGIGQLDAEDEIVWLEAGEAPREAIERVHPAGLVDNLAALAAAGGGAIDPDTFVSERSYEAARRAAGAGLDLIDALRAGQGDLGWSIVRPPGHHALADQQMGFCLLNNIAVAARSLTAQGERVAIVDVDAHHGNGTQAIFYDDPEVLFVSLHQYPWYPFTGRPDEVGTEGARGTTVNIAMPAGTAGRAYRRAIDDVVVPVLERHRPDWVLVSAGFDGHHKDPITDLGLSSADYADLIGRIVAVVPKGRRVLFLEGGYDLEALRDSVASVTANALGVAHRPEPPTAGGPGEDMVELARAIHLRGGPGDT